MSPQFCKVHHLHLLPITDRFPYQYCLSCLSAWCLFILDDFWKAVVFPTTQFGYQKGLGTCDTLLCMAHTLQSALESGQEARIMQIDFSAAFERVNHQGILYKLCSLGIGRSKLSIQTLFQTNRSQHIMVDGCQSKLVNIVSGVLQGSVFCPLLFLLYTSELFTFL